MNPIVTIFLLLFMALSCKTESKKIATHKEEEQPRTIPEKIAYAHGYAHWDAVKEIAFTFHVSRNDAHLKRTWRWKPKLNQVTTITETDTLAYSTTSMDSTTHKINANFINDRYWLLAPFHLIWDSDAITYTYVEEEHAPLSDQPMQKLTVVYGNKGGYTPGDAYDLYFKDDYIIREWVYRKSNQKDPSLVCTWEDYTDVEGLLLAQNHRSTEMPFHLYFTDLTVRKD